MYLIETKNRGDKMDEIFTKKVRTAAVAGWWTLLIVYCILLIQWLAYVLIMSRQPAGLLCVGEKALHGWKFVLSGCGQWWHISSASE
jgi:hypothetical protein